MPRWLVPLLVVSTLTAAGAAWLLRPAPTEAPHAAASYVGSDACAGCHRAQHSAWLGSQHQLAMRHATPDTVLGDFGGARFSYAGITSTFFQRDGRFFVRTDGADGRMADFEIKYTFGIAPLQQYLVEFPDGRIQALSIAWDARPKAQGGQRWYHLYPAERVTHADPVHWTRSMQNWNFMCAECHSMGVRKNYDPDADAFQTRWSEISVGCEACHGPGSAHVDWARRPRSDASMGLAVRFDERAGVRWTPDPASGNAVRSAPRAGSKEVETCALCHARRAQIREGHLPGRPLADTHIPALLTGDLFEADGQMREEVFNHASFLQSRMFQAGVTCSDCHDPHSGKLRGDGSTICLQCHSADKYAGVSHTGHAPAPRAPACVDCHMPVRTYMVIDPRHDHGFRVPRPDLSVRYGTPNACNDCHRERSPAWAAAAVERWHGPQRKGLQAWTPAFHAARAGAVESKNLLFAVAEDRGQPAIGRATAYAELSAYVSPSLLPELRKGLHDDSELVRIGALRGLASLPMEQRWAYAGHLLSDPVGSVRIEAVSFLLGVAPETLAPELRAVLDRAVEEYIAVQRLNADRPEAHLNLGLLHAHRRAADQAEREYRAALKIDPGFVQAYVNLADLYRDQGRDGDGEKVLRDGLRTQPAAAALHHALGLLQVRQKQPGAALGSLARAAKADPANPRYAYVQGIALHSANRRSEALSVLDANHRRHPADRDTLMALVSMHREAGAAETALAYARKLQVLLPAEPDVQQLVRQLEAGE